MAKPTDNTSLAHSHRLSPAPATVGCHRAVARSRGPGLEAEHPAAALRLFLTPARTLWTEMLDAKSFPPDEQIIRLIAGLQFPTIRDHFMAYIPGIDELLAQTHSKPHWSRNEWAEQLLLHAYTRSSTRHFAPILTAIAFIRWWECGGSKAHQFPQLALEAGPPTDWPGSAS